MQFFTRALALAAAVVPFLAQAAPVAGTRAGELVPGKWIVRLKPEADVATIAAHHVKVREIHARNIARRDVAEEETGGVEREYGFGGFKGYAGAFDIATVEELKNRPEVLSVEADSIMTILELVTQENAPWGLASISSRTNGATSYTYDSSAGTGHFNYVVDTGIRTTHQEFAGRAQWGYNAVNTNNADSQGHGTHVSGTIAGLTYGVAKNATLIAVKVFEGSSGTASTVIAGFDWAVNDIVAQSRQTTAVVNLSLGGAGSPTWDAAISAAWAAGVLAVAAAGNENQPADTRSPARSPEALTVGNVQSNDARYGGASGSNYGPAVDVFAAGTDILSAYRTSDVATARLSGTSMACPHVAGLVSYVRGVEGPMTAEVVKARVLELATKGRVTDAKGSANLLAFNGVGEV
ncbi:peptidase S8/S53 domain-containing protein [Massariosphaeria phaeospora]|uniref:Peptidase S8/S53 domain-containing protein n=1 Tax=Massariosphaeria phaeospora TaxID=100035 RepID=A0A7C8M6Q1_9PLEO|nr:peptidase S8/S53 domain-containing protein [Massariosphaeria phaeospora]